MNTYEIAEITAELNRRVLECRAELTRRGLDKWRTQFTTGDGYRTGSVIIVYNDANHIATMYKNHKGDWIAFNDKHNIHQDQECVQALANLLDATT